MEVNKNKSISEKENLAKLSRFENKNNFNNYHINIISSLSKSFNEFIFNFLDGKNIKYATDIPFNNIFQH